MNREHYVDGQTATVFRAVFEQDKLKKAIENDKVAIWYNVLGGLKKNTTGEIDKTSPIDNIYNVKVLPTEF